MGAPQELIAGRYRLTRRIAAGGMGVVWEGRDELLERAVAVKQLRTQIGVSEEEAAFAKQRAMREGRITARLHHPNAVVVFDSVEHDGEPCLVMQYVPSRPLSSILRERGRLPAGEVARIGAQIAGALAAAHDLGIVHRDVKPGNILIRDADGAAMLSDFGISHALGDATVTSTSLVHGTPAYLAPEVARGEESSLASDVFSLGSTLYAASEGEAPFGEAPNSVAVLHRVALGGFQAPQRSGPLGALLLQMMTDDPDARPPMTEVARRLAALQTEEEGSEAQTVPLVSTEDFETAAIAVDHRTKPFEHPDAEEGEAPAGAAAGAAAVGAAAVAAGTRDLEGAEATQAAEAPGRTLGMPTAQAPTADVAPTRTLEPVAEPEAGASVSGAVADERSEPPASETPVEVPSDSDRPAAASPDREEPERAAAAAPAALAEAPPPAGPPEVTDRRRPGRRLAGAVVLLAVLVLGGLGLVRVLQPDDDSRRTPSAAGSVAPRSSSAAPTASASPTPVRTTSTPSPAAPSSAAPPAPAPTRTAPSTPSAAPRPTATSTPRPQGATLTASGMVSAISRYYGLVPGNRGTAFSLLTADYQVNHAGGRSGYDAFWEPISSASAAGVRATGSDSVRATITYRYRSGRVVVEDTSYRMVAQSGVLKIADSTVLSSRG